MRLSLIHLSTIEENLGYIYYNIRLYEPSDMHRHNHDDDIDSNHIAHRIDLYHIHIPTFNLVSTADITSMSKIFLSRLNVVFFGKDGKHGEKKVRKDIFGIHHVTAITSNPRRNIDFYTNDLGLRLVKLTVNQDDPTSYHLYYGDNLGRPGTILTFFHWPHIVRGLRGTSEVTATSFLVPQDSISYWVDRLKTKQMEFRGPYRRFDDEQVITLNDPDGLELELVAHESAKDRSVNLWKGATIPAEHAIRGFYSVTLSEEGYERTASILTQELGFVSTLRDRSRFRYEIPVAKSVNHGEDLRGANIVDVVCLPYTPKAVIGIGSVHHVAWRTPTDNQQMVLREKIIKAGLNPTPVIDRFYFHSVYFREPGGILFEVATNPPGFAIDEKTEDLGTHLVLPPWLEPMRSDLEKVLPKVVLAGKETKV